jgi:primosomal protein N' (replication factor Y)
MSRTRRLTAVKKILENSFSVVLGTRSAVFAPLKNLSFIAVMNEQSSSYKAEEALRYNGRDVAVMRASIEQSCVLLSSVCPSLESLHNVRNGKYVLLAADQRPQSPSRSGVDMVSARPRIVVIDIRSRRSPEIILSREVVSTVRNLGSADTRLLFLVNKKGYSHIRCEECGHPVQCPQCRVPLIYYKGKNAVKCRFCGLEHSLTLTCEKCGSFSLKPSGTGTERLKEEVEKLLQQTVSILDKEHAKYIVKQVSADDPDSTRFVVGTSYATRKVAQSSLSAAVFLNIDAALNQPDFRAHERTFQDIMLVSQLMKPDGTIFIQTHNPAHPVIRFVKTYNFKGFFEYESAQRKALRFPPFSRIIHMTLLFKKGPHISLEAIRKNINAQDLNRVELWGPVEIPCHSKKWMSSIQIVLKSENRRLLHPAAKNILAEFKELKSVKIVVDVDPLKI